MGSGTPQGRTNPDAHVLHGHTVPGLAGCCWGSSLLCWSCASHRLTHAREGWCSEGLYRAQDPWQGRDFVSGGPRNGQGLSPAVSPATALAQGKPQGC